MDASASAATVYGYVLGIDKSNFPGLVKQNNTVIKYTKIPDYDIDSRPLNWTDGFAPRFRQIITVNESILDTTRSLKNVYNQTSGSIPHSKRKIVTITEDDNMELPSHRLVTPNRIKVDNRAVQSISGSSTGKKTPHARMIRRDDKERKISARKSSNVTVNPQKVPYKPKSLQIREISPPVTQAKDTNKSTGQNRIFRNTNTNVASVSVITKKYDKPNSNETRNKTPVYTNARAHDFSPKKFLETKAKTDSFLSRSPNRKHYANVINVPATVTSSRKIDTEKQLSPRDNRNETNKRELSKKGLHNQSVVKRDSGTTTNVVYKDAETAVDRSCLDYDIYVDTKELHETISRVEAQGKVIGANDNLETKIIGSNDNLQNKFICPNDNLQSKFKGQNDNLQSKFIGPNDNIQSKFIGPNDNLQNKFIGPNDSLQSKFIGPNDYLQVPDVSLTNEKDGTILEKVEIPRIVTPTSESPPRCNAESNKSFVIGSATFTYTTKRQINIQVLGKEEPLSELNSVLPKHPVNVISVFKKQLISDNENESPNNSSHSFNGEHIRQQELRPANCAYQFNRDKLVKPSEIISGIRLNTLINNDYLTEQFNRELSFIDSFFESLQYLESCSLTDKRVTDETENWINNNLEIDNPDYNQLLSSLDNSSGCDIDTLASKSLCLLNLLIRDEQRRAKNLLFVLKMREDALRDFTKSQILWLENKKKLDNTDVSTLKKKQRGALLKLQQECGEMQRMKNTFLTLSEKRKAALIKTKKNIELKLNNNVDVNKIISNKKSLRKSPTAEKANTPLRCFELSSSTCDETYKSTKASREIVSAEKCVQTNDSVIEISSAAENFVVVDGGYLNILFQNLNMPRIFSGAKQYEVNEAALRNVVESSNSSRICDSRTIEGFMDQMRSREEKSTSPSTARSLVDEFDQYYKVLNDDENSIFVCDDVKSESSVLKSDDSVCVCNEGTQWVSDSATVNTQTGPLPVPVGASEDKIEENTQVAVVETVIGDNAGTSSMNMEIQAQSALIDSAIVSALVTPVSSPVNSEAETLRQQQLAIEKEIKELEQAQNQLLAVREIPDKPPPPYTPPAERSRRFAPKEITEDVVRKFKSDYRHDPNDIFDVYCYDLACELQQRESVDSSDVPWEAVNMLPRKPVPTEEETITRTVVEMKEILNVAAPTTITGLSTRRSDHIDDILFTEWRRCEPEWTGLHIDEVTVKNQLFESIFQKVLSETVDDYKKAVLKITD